MKKIMLAMALVGALGLVSSACTPRAFRMAATAAVVTAAIVGTAHVLAHHDAHFHHAGCGCRRHYHDGHWVYYYGDRWEYYDDYSGNWYYYVD